jgi:hypothetical protein
MKVPLVPIQYEMWQAPGASLDILERRKISCPSWTSNPHVLKPIF